VGAKAREGESFGEEHEEEESRETHGDILLSNVDRASGRGELGLDGRSLHGAFGIVRGRGKGGLEG
jgi:hypothetical protein